ncbi:unknown [Firmicutes bacterium CAG:791]|nr:unknown [Firmicutes bacterium CAG:791]
MAGRHVDACNGAELPDGIGQLGRRAKRRKQEHPDAVSCENLCTQLGKFSGVIAAVIGDDYAAGNLLAGVKNVVGDALRGASNGECVHAVGSCAADAAKSSGSKNNFLIEAVCDRRLVSLDGSKLLMHRIRRVQAVQPELI